MMKAKNLVRFSARSSNGKIDMGELMKKGIEGLEDANGGGHIPAAAAQVRSEDAEIFKKRVLEDD
jgi:single-stranded DNA-specific DHH superfamily exonuclease